MEQTNTNAALQAVREQVVAKGKSAITSSHKYLYADFDNSKLISLSSIKSLSISNTLNKPVFWS